MKFLMVSLVLYCLKKDLLLGFGTALMPYFFFILDVRVLLHNDTLLKEGASGYVLWQGVVTFYTLKYLKLYLSLYSGHLHNITRTS